MSDKKIRYPIRKEKLANLKIAIYNSICIEEAIFHLIQLCDLKQNSADELVSFSEDIRNKKKEFKVEFQKSIVHFNFESFRFYNYKVNCKCGKNIDDYLDFCWHECYLLINGVNSKLIN